MDEPVLNPPGDELPPQPQPIMKEPALIAEEHSPAPPPLEPVAKAARITEMDIVRGIAILGVFLINMPLFNAPASAFFQSTEATGWWPQWNHQAALWFISTFAQGKFYTLFSFLFGMGFGVQMMRAEVQGVATFTRIYLRRLFVLLGIGLMHYLLFWWGDVLHVYASLGFLLLLFLKRAQKTVLIWAFWLAAGPLIGTAGFFAFDAVRDHYRTPEKKLELQKEKANNQKQRAERRQKMRNDMHKNKVIMSTGTVKEVFTERFREVRRQLPGELSWSIELFTNFLFGLWLARSGKMEKVSGNLGFFRKVFAFGLVGGLGLSVLTHWPNGMMPDNAPDWQQALVGMSQEFIARPLLSAFYGSGVILLVQFPFWRKFFSSVAAVGRMALTNYLTHTIISTTLFYSYGFGLYGQVGPAWGLLLCLVIYGLQLPFSVWWLNRYKFGPMEYVWRSLTYGKRQPMRLAE